MLLYTFVSYTITKSLIISILHSPPIVDYPAVYQKSIAKKQKFCIYGTQVLKRLDMTHDISNYFCHCLEVTNKPRKRKA